MTVSNKNNANFKSPKGGFKGLSHLPNFITCLNLFSGSVAVYYAFQGNYAAVLFFVLLAAVFDFLDGFAARLLKAYSPMGKELDSLADIISFGLAPGAVVFSVLSESALPHWAAFAGFIIPVFSGLRLAKFNIDERQTTSFIGMPVPANAIFWVGFGFSYHQVLSGYYWIVLLLSVVMSGLLVSELPMFSLKLKSLKWKDNSWQFVFLAVCCCLLIVFRLDAFSLIIVWYILLSIIRNFRK
jgi:CDP-diacylglycerol--serine O-phosphatidyltransferase